MNCLIGFSNIAVSFEKECTDCAECKFDGNIKWALGGSGHTQEQCLEACRQNQDCMYVSISTDGYCHMMPTCPSNDGSGWTRFKRTSENPFDPKRGKNHSNNRLLIALKE